MARYFITVTPDDVKADTISGAIRRELKPDFDWELIRTNRKRILIQGNNKEYIILNPSKRLHKMLRDNMYKNKPLIEGRYLVTDRVMRFKNV